MVLFLIKVAKLFLPNVVRFCSGRLCHQLCPRAQKGGRQGICPPMFESMVLLSSNIVIISGERDRDFNEFEEIWTVVRSEDLFVVSDQR